jgi:hypothetical protein
VRKISGQKRIEVIEGQRKLNIEKLQNLYSSPDITTIIKLRRTEWEDHVARMAKKEASIGKPEGKKPL